MNLPPAVSAGSLIADAGLCSMRILIADDDFQVRGALRLLIEQQLDLAVVDEVSSIGQLSETMSGVAPDAVLLDWELPVGDHRHLIKEFKLRWPNANIIALSALPESKKKALESGAMAFVSKSDPPEGLIRLIKSYSAE
jgi:DNA-binding NarL/FixJ family response regulator